ncbi:hypothetical protein I4L69_001645 [Enterococcus faecium]|nr:hypothetical protein [Enterococcus faecium]
MSTYLQDYLKAIPLVDAEKIRSVIQANQDTMIIQNLSEEEFERLIQYVSNKEAVQTKMVEIDKEITAEQFNEFYSNVQIDLLHLFTEQNLLEGIGENYERIYEGNLEDIRNHLNKLKQRASELDMESEGEEGLIVHSYNFDPTQMGKNIETNRENLSNQLWEDRDGTILNNADVDRNFHHYYACLSKENQMNLLVDEKGQSNATIEITYESPNVVAQPTNNYEITNTIDGNVETFWYSVALKQNNGLDKTTINPEVIS